MNTSSSNPPEQDVPRDRYRERERIARAVYERIVLRDDFLPYTCAGSSAVLQGILGHFGHAVGRTGVAPVEQGPGGEQVHVVAHDDRYVYDLAYTQFRRLRAFGSPIIERTRYETRFLLLPTLVDPLECGPDFYRLYLHRLGDFRSEERAEP
ncbi:MAG: hypothetical protein HZB55_23095 [Deltaproteobacteria bacterium]|nr:hypothetical protein [Deltaproteobacteria bacterium]